MVYELWVIAWSTNFTATSSASFKVWQWLVTTHLSSSSHTDSKVCGCIAFLPPNDKFMQHGYSKEEDSQQRWKHSTETKRDDTGSEICSRI